MKETDSLDDLGVDGIIAYKCLSSKYFFFVQCHHISFVDFVVLPTGHGRSVTDF